MKINGPGESSLLLLKVIGLLAKFKIPYVIVGAFAASFYGQVRASVDADAVISVDGREKTLEKLSVSLEKIGYKVELRHGDAQDPVRGVMSIQDKFHNRVDLLTGIRGMNDDIFDRAVTASFIKKKIKIVSVEDFIAMKVFAGSFKDIEDVVVVLAVCKGKVDLPLARKLSLGYGKKELGRLEALIKSKR
jgi:hypothetical protein